MFLARVAEPHLIHIQHKGRAWLKVGDFSHFSYAHKLQLYSCRLSLTLFIVVLAGLNRAMGNGLQSSYAGDEAPGSRNYIRGAGLCEKDHKL